MAQYNIIAGTGMPSPHYTTREEATLVARFNANMHDRVMYVVKYAGPYWTVTDIRPPRSTLGFTWVCPVILTDPLRNIAT
jgi:hypothetical protein